MLTAFPCPQVVLLTNISVLQETVEQLRQTEANLTAQLRLQEGNSSVGKSPSAPGLFLAALSTRYHGDP